MLIRSTIQPVCCPAQIRFHLDRALFHFKQEHIILLRTQSFHLYFACVCPWPRERQCVCATLSRCLSSALFFRLCIGYIWRHWSKPPAGPGLAWSHFPPQRSLFVGRRPIMEMIQQLFKLQISLSFCVATLRVLLFLVCPLFLRPSPPFYCHLVKPCQYYLSYLPEERANCIRGTCLTNALPLSLWLSLPSVELLAWLPASYCVINIHTVVVCLSSLQVVELSQNVVGPHRWGLVCCMSLPLLFWDWRTL